MEDFVFYYMSNKHIWGNCSLAVADWFSKTEHCSEQKNLIVLILFEKISMIESGKIVNVIGLQEPMGIIERDLYLQVLFEIKKHIVFIRMHGFSLLQSINLAIYTMCNYYYYQNCHISSFILDALV